MQTETPERQQELKLIQDKIDKLNHENQHDYKFADLPQSDWILVGDEDRNVYVNNSYFDRQFVASTID